MNNIKSWLWGVLILGVLGGMLWKASHIWIAGNNATMPLPSDPATAVNGVNPLAQASFASSYRQVAVFTSGLQQAHALLVTPRNELVIAGSRMAVWLDDHGRYLGCHKLPADTRCLTYGPEGSLWVGMRTGTVARLSSKGVVEAAWSVPGSNALITAIVVTESVLFAADAGQRKIWCLNFSSGTWTTFPHDTGKAGDGFIIPSPYFDLFLTSEKQLHVVNPGRHRIEIYSWNGDLYSQWGRASWALDGFCGCCNPAYIIPAPGGRTITSEKGIRRIKLYSAEGRLEEVVAGPDKLGNANDPCPVALDRLGRIIILDPLTAKVYLFAQPAATAPLPEKAP